MRRDPHTVLAELSDPLLFAYDTVYSFKTILNETMLSGLFQLERLDFLWNFISSDKFHSANFDHIINHLYFINSL